MALREGFKQCFSWSTDKPVVFAKYAQLTDIGRVACNRTPDYRALGNRWESGGGISPNRKIEKLLHCRFPEL